MQKLVAGIGLTVATVIALPAVAFAHVVVKPAETTVGSFTTYTMGVPNEKEVAVTGMRLVVPANLKYVSPTVHTGWTIETKKSGETVTEINWTGGEVPVGQRDDFSFSAQAPAKTTELNWKAYETYADGTTQAWDQKPTTNESDDDEAKAGPYSVTKVVNDLTDTTAAADTTENDSSASTTANLALGASLVAVIIGVVALIKRNKA